MSNKDQNHMSYEAMKTSLRLHFQARGIDINSPTFDKNYSKVVEGMMESDNIAQDFAGLVEKAEKEIPHLDQPYKPFPKALKQLDEGEYDFNPFIIDRLKNRLQNQQESRGVPSIFSAQAADREALRKMGLLHQSIFPLTEEEIEKINREMWEEIQRQNAMSPPDIAYMTLTDDHGNFTCHTQACGKCVKCQQTIRKLAREHEFRAEVYTTRNPKPLRYPIPFGRYPAITSDFEQPEYVARQFGKGRFASSLPFPSGGFRRGQLATIAASPRMYLTPKSNFVAEIVAGAFSSGRSPWIYTPEVIENALRNFDRSLYNNRSSQWAGLWHKPQLSSLYFPTVEEIEDFKDLSPFIRISRDEIVVGGFTVGLVKRPGGLFHDWMEDTVSLRARLRHASSQFGATVDYEIDQHLLKSIAFWESAAAYKFENNREPWAEDAIDFMLYLKMYGEPVPTWSTRHNCALTLFPNKTLLATMVWPAKQAARERLRQANNVERDKRGY